MRIWMFILVLIIVMGCAKDPLSAEETSPVQEPETQRNVSDQPTYDDVNLDEYYQEALDKYSECPDGYTLAPSGEERFYCEPERCPEGYVLTTRGSPAFATVTKYCRIDKEWEEFVPCVRQEDCEGNLTCMSPDFPAQGFRCVPVNEYPTDCGFYPPDGKGWCI